MEIEYNTVSPLRLVRALLIYNSNDDVAITEHSVKGTEIQSDGKPLDLTSFSRLIAGGRERDAIEWLSPDLLAVTAQWRLWWTPPQMKEVFIVKNYKRSMKSGGLVKSWFPGFVWCGHRHRPSLYLWAFAGKKKPAPDAVLYKPSYGPEGSLDHIFQHTPGAVCLGSAAGGDHSVSAWQRAWWDSLFKTSRNLETKPYNVTKKFKRLGTLSELAAKITSGKAAD